MGFFATRGSRPALALGAHEELSAAMRLRVPPRFEAVAEALAGGGDAGAACSYAGRVLARDGLSLEETLAGLRETSRAVTGRDPSYDAVAALLGAWSDAALSYLHQLTCQDPVTGLASPAHVRSRLSDLYRQRGPGVLGDRWALVVCELPQEGQPRADQPRADQPRVDQAGADQSREDRRDSGSRRLTQSLQLARVGETARTVFVRGETIGRIGPRRIVVVAERDQRLGSRVRLWRSLASGILGAAAPRVWIEGLPASDATAGLVLDELAR